MKLKEYDMSIGVLETILIWAHTNNKTSIAQAKHIKVGHIAALVQYTLDIFWDSEVILDVDNDKQFKLQICEIGVCLNSRFSNFLNHIIFHVINVITKLD